MNHLGHTGFTLAVEKQKDDEPAPQKAFKLINIPVGFRVDATRGHGLPIPITSCVIEPQDLVAAGFQDLSNKEQELWEALASFGPEGATDADWRSRTNRFQKGGPQYLKLRALLIESGRVIEEETDKVRGKKFWVNLEPSNVIGN